jgi:hypothetical protein
LRWTIAGHTYIRSTSLGIWVSSETLTCLLKRLRTVQARYFPPAGMRSCTGSSSGRQQKQLHRAHATTSQRTAGYRKVASFWRCPASTELRTHAQRTLNTKNGRNRGRE